MHIVDAAEKWKPFMDKMNDPAHQAMLAEKFKRLGFAEDELQKTINSAMRSYEADLQADTKYYLVTYGEGMERTVNMRYEPPTDDTPYVLAVGYSDMRQKSHDLMGGLDKHWPTCPWCLANKGVDTQPTVE